MQDDEERAACPLTRVAADGRPYTRSALVEQKIADALRRAPRAVVEQARCDNQDAPAFLPEECLVYLIRHYHQRGDVDAVNGLFAILLGRCDRLLKARLGGLGRQEFEDAVADCAAELARQILDLSSDRGDFLQVRFWKGLTLAAITVFNRRAAARRRAEHAVRVDADPADDDAAPDTVDLPDRGLSVEQRALYRDALAAVGEPARTAFVLRHYYGWPVEDDDPAVPTISRHFGKTPRTIRNYLRRAEESLAPWRGDQS